LEIELRIEPEVILENIKKIYEKFNCLIVVCIKWDDLYYERDITFALEACNSLGDDVWSKAIIAITQCDTMPPSIEHTTDQHKKVAFIQHVKHEWISLIKKELSTLEVSDDIINNIPICFTSHTAISCEVEPEWVEKLNDALIV
jgi:hypothetical protein